MPTADSGWGRFLSRSRGVGLYEYNFRLALRNPIDLPWDADTLDRGDSTRNAGQLEGAAYISLAPWRDQRVRYLRIEYSPNAAGEGGRARLRRFLDELLDGRCDDFIRQAFVTRVDVGFDVYRLPLKNILVTQRMIRGRQNRGARLFVGKDGELETIYTPLAKSRYLVLYDKTKEINAKRGKQARLEGSLYSPSVGSRTRIEYRSHGLKEMRFVELAQQLPNPFEQFDLREFHWSGRLPAFKERLFFDALKTRPAINLFREMVAQGVAGNAGNEVRALRVAMNRYPVPSWWSPDALWSEFPSAFRAIGLPVSNRRRR